MRGTQKERKLRAVALLIASSFLLSGLLLPWLSMEFKWSTTSEIIEGDVSFQANGLGMANFDAYLYCYNMSANQIVVDSKISVSTVIPSQMGVGTLIVVMIILNSIMGGSFLYDKFKRLLPRVLQKQVETRWSTIVFIEGLTILAIVTTFSTFYFYVPFDITAHTPEHFLGNASNLLGIYRNTYNFFKWARDAFRASAAWDRNLNPGIGMYLTLIGGGILIYLWFINFIQKNEWPKVWQKRGILLPLMVLLAFMPVARKYSKTSATTLPFLFSPVLSHAGGISYLVLVGLLTYVIRKATLAEQKIDELVKKIYTTAEDEFTEESFHNIRTQLEKYRTLSAKYRRYVVPILLAILLVVILTFSDIMSMYKTFVGEIPEANWLVHTPTDWLLFFSPVVTIILTSIFRH